MDLSIIIPMYNAENTIEKTLDSLLSQKVKDIEIIIVDDGSKDNSLNIVKSYKDKDDRVIIIQQENKGVSAARNKGVCNSRGKYITFVDSDDYVDIYIYEKLLKKAKETNADIVKCTPCTEFRDGSGKNKNYFDLDDTLVYNKEFINQSIIKTLIGINYKNIKKWLNGERYNQYYFVWASLYKKDIIDNIYFDESISIGEDLLYNMEAFYKADTFTIVNEPLYYWVDNKDSITRKLNPEVCINKVDALEKRKLFCEKYDLDETYKDCYRGQTIFLCLYSIMHLSNFRYKDIKKYMKDLFNREIVIESRAKLKLKYAPFKYMIPMALVKANWYIIIYILLRGFNLIKRIKVKNN